MADFSKIGRSNVQRSKAHERRVAHLLTDWSAISFRRRRVEGRGETVSLLEGVSDVIAVERRAAFAIEAKCGKDFSFDALLANPKTALFTVWWHQCCYDTRILTKTTGRQAYPLVFFKPVPNHTWIAISQRAFGPQLRPRPELRDNIDPNGPWFHHLSYPNYSSVGPIEHNVSMTKNRKNYVYEALQLDDVVFARWNDFAAAVDPESFFFGD